MHVWLSVKKTETYSTMTASISFTWRGCYFGKASSSVQVSQRFHNLLILDRTWERLTCWKLFKCTFTSTQTWNRCLSIIIYEGSFNEYFKFLAKINGKVKWRLGGKDWPVAGWNSWPATGSNDSSVNMYKWMATSGFLLDDGCLSKLIRWS